MLVPSKKGKKAKKKEEDARVRILLHSKHLVHFQPTPASSTRSRRRSAGRRST